MRRALFLDRDGVINIDRDYLYRIEDFHWQPGIFDLTRAAVRKGFDLVVVTNQSGIGRGYYSEEEFQALTSWMCHRFTEENAPIAAVYHCPFHPLSVHPEYRVVDHPWRKPRPGMLLAARDTLGLDLPSSILIGDRESDIEAGAAAGVGRLVFVGEQARDNALTRALRFTTVADAALWMADDVA